MADRRSLQSDIYTVLILIALVILLVGIGYVLLRSQQLGFGNPFSTQIQGWIVPMLSLG